MTKPREALPLESLEPSKLSLKAPLSGAVQQIAAPTRGLGRTGGRVLDRTDPTDSAQRAFDQEAAKLLIMKLALREETTSSLKINLLRKNQTNHQTNENLVISIFEEIEWQASRADLKELRLID